MEEFFSLPCVILSGGKSSRMQEDKSLLAFGNSTSLIEFQYKRLKPYFKDTFISSKEDKFIFLKDKSKLILDKNLEIYSPILALKAIFETIQEKKIFLITVDTPFVKIESINKIIEASKKFDICVATTSKTHNLCGIFASKCLPIINHMIENDIHKINFLIRQVNHSLIKFSDEDEFLNINTKDEYQKGLKIIN